MSKIVSNPEILGGKPIVRGTRLSVDFILNLLASGVSEKDILDDYQHLTVDDIHACLAYAANALKNDIYLELEKVK